MRESIKIPNSVVVSGITDTDIDEVVSTFLEKHGSINRHFRIDAPESDFHHHVIVEFTYGTAMLTLEPLLPLKLESSVQPGASYEVQSLASVYALNARNIATRAYMTQLQEIAKLSGNSLEQMLKEELASLASSTIPLHGCQDTSFEQTPLPQTEPLTQGDLLSSPSPHPANSSEPSALESPLDPLQPCTSSTLNKNLIDFTPLPTPPAAANGTFQPTLDLNPPSVQRVVVEHVVRSSETTSHFAIPSRLRAFSGKSPRPNNEADYDTWRTSVEVLMKDPAISDLNCTHRILDSLLPPAAEMTKHLGPQAKPSAYLDILDSAFGAVEDGDELYARFLSTLQNEGEKPSSFLQRLHVCLSMTMRRGGVSASEFDKQLLKQFCRGCWDNALIVDLQLQQKKGSPPSFAELLLMLRTEEDKQAAKVSRMRQHLGTAKPAPCAAKQRVMSHLQTVHATAESEIDILKKQIADITAQVSSLKRDNNKQEQPARQKAKSLAESAKVEARPVKKKVSQHQSPVAKVHSKPRPWYCFQCGEDGHIASACDNEPNPSLVAAKKKQLRERQAIWEASNVPEEKPHLN